jgi:uncharacterized RDD family membrane protein YckC
VSGYTTTPPPGAGGPPVTGGRREALTGQHVLAGWWSRVFAQIIDGVIIGAGAVVLLIAITAPFSVGFFANDTVGVVSLFVGAFIGVLCVAFVALLYAPAMMARTNGKTVGRIVLGIRVVRANGRPVDFGYAVLREVVVKALLGGICATITGGLSWIVDNLWPLWDEENRALHDFVVDSRVIRG